MTMASYRLCEPIAKLCLRHEIFLQLSQLSYVERLLFLWIARRHRQRINPFAIGGEFYMNHSSNPCKMSIVTLLAIISIDGCSRKEGCPTGSRYKGYRARVSRFHAYPLFVSALQGSPLEGTAQSTANTDVKSDGYGLSGDRRHSVPGKRRQVPAITFNGNHRLPNRL